MSENFYIGVSKKGSQADVSPRNFRLVAGPFASLEIAEQHYNRTARYVRKIYYMEGADFWFYSIVGIEDYDQPGQLNEAIDEALNEAAMLAERLARGEMVQMEMFESDTSR